SESARHEAYTRKAPGTRVILPEQRLSSGPQTLSGRHPPKHAAAQVCQFPGQSPSVSRTKQFLYLGGLQHSTKVWVSEDHLSETTTACFKMVLSLFFGGSADLHARETRCV